MRLLICCGNHLTFNNLLNTVSINPSYFTASWKVVYKAQGLFVQWYNTRNHFCQGLTHFFLYFFFPNFTSAQMKNSRQEPLPVRFEVKYYRNNLVPYEY